MTTTQDAPHGASEPAAQADPAQGNTATEPNPQEPAQATDWEAEAKKWEKRAKENGANAKELQKLREASMSEAEKAVHEAETRGRTTAVAEFGQRLARSEFDALAGRRNPDLQSKDIDEILEFTDIAKFVGEDGQPDSKRISAAVERLVPEISGVTRTPGFDGGTRTPPPRTDDMSSRIRRATGRQ